MPRPTSLESFYYEFKPYIIVLLGVYGLSLGHHSYTAKFAGLTLLACSGAILYMRARYRGLIRSKPVNVLSQIGRGNSGPVAMLEAEEGIRTSAAEFKNSAGN